MQELDNQATIVPLLFSQRSFTLTFLSYSYTGLHQCHVSPSHAKRIYLAQNMTAHTIGQPTFPSRKVDLGLQYDEHESSGTNLPVFGLKSY
jgi:hypothetical protein